MKIPEHLRELRRDAHGRPVPWINVWGKGEDTERWTIRYDRSCKRVAAFLADLPDGEPDFTRQSPQRQRACMVYGLCQVCARPVDWSARHLVISSVSVEVIDLQATKVPAVTEPWLCPDCAVFAVRHCPALIRRKSAEDLLVVHVKGPDECQLVMSEGWIEGPYEQATRQSPVAMWAKVIAFNTQIQITARR